MRGINRCPYCGSHNVVVLSRKSDHPFDKRSGREETICLDCRGKLPTGGNEYKPETKKSVEEELAELLEEFYQQEQLLKHVVRLEGVSYCKGTKSQSVTELPYEDGEYSMAEMGYPLCHFPKVVIKGETVNLDGEVIKIGRHPVTIKREFTAYGYDKVPWTEFAEITITEDWKTV